jgi:hypothetical protein
MKEKLILSRVRVTINGVWIGNWICDHLQIVTTRNYSANANLPLSSSLQHVLSLLSLPYLHLSLPGDGSQ